MCRQLGFRTQRLRGRRLQHQQRRLQHVVQRLKHIWRVEQRRGRVDNAFLDHKSPDPKGYGYAVFGKVTAGIDVVTKIGAVKTTGKPKDKPLKDVLITSITRVK